MGEKKNLGTLRREDISHFEIKELHWGGEKGLAKNTDRRWYAIGKCGQ